LREGAGAASFSESDTGGSWHRGRAIAVGREYRRAVIGFLLQLARRHAGLGVVLALHQALFWAVVLSNNPQATVTFDCVTGTMGTEILKGFSFGMLDAYDGVLAGMFMAATFGTPVFAVFGFTGFSVKLAAALFAGTTIVAGYAFLHRAVGRLGATLGAATLAFAPPIHFLASVILGNWHYTEIVFDMVCALLLVRMMFARPDDPAPGGRFARLRAWTLRPAGFAITWGVANGLALVNSFGSLIFLGGFWLTALATLRDRVTLRLQALFVGGIVVGATPFWWKVLFYAPYGETAGVSKAPVPEEVTNISVDLGKISEMFLDGGFAYGLHFQDVLGTPAGSAFAGSLAVVVTWTLFGGWIGLLIRTAPSLGRILAGLVPGRPTSPARISPAVLPAGMGLAYFVAFLLSDMNLELLPWYITNPRELGHAILTPWTMVLGISAGVLAARLIEEARGGDVHEGELALPALGPLPKVAAGAAAAGWLALVAVNAYGMARAAQPDGYLPGLRSAFRGACWDVHGFYMTPYLGLDLDRAHAACEQYGEARAEECRRGATWALGYNTYDPFAEEDGREVVELGGPCLSLGEPWRAECMRGVGWSLQSAGAGGMTLMVDDTSACDSFADSADQTACWHGVGFPLGDHLHTVPLRLMTALRDMPPERRMDIAQGAALHIGRTYSSWATMQRLCGAWDADLRDSCLAGVEASLAFRSDADEVRAR